MTDEERIVDLKRSAEGLLLPVNRQSLGWLLAEYERTNELIKIFVDSSKCELSTMDLLFQRCCGEITVHGFPHDVKWERIDEYRIKPTGKKCSKCGKEWDVQFICRSDELRKQEPVNSEELVGLRRDAARWKEASE